MLISIIITEVNVYVYSDRFNAIILLVRGVWWVIKVKSTEKHQILMSKTFLYHYFIYSFSD